MAAFINLIFAVLLALFVPSPRSVDPALAQTPAHPQGAPAWAAAPHQVTWTWTGRACPEPAADSEPRFMKVYLGARSSGQNGTVRCITLPTPFPALPVVPPRTAA